MDTREDIKFHRKPNPPTDCLTLFSKRVQRCNIYNYLRHNGAIILLNNKLFTIKPTISIVSIRKIINDHSKVAGSTIKRDYLYY